MRDVKRIWPLMAKVADDWGYFCPDWRFGQLISNFMRWHGTTHGTSDIFYLEDEIFLSRWNEFIHEFFCEAG